MLLGDLQAVEAHLSNRGVMHRRQTERSETESQKRQSSHDVAAPGKRKSKFELEQREIKIRALNQVKDKVNHFELKLLAHNG
jgi:hypothetical protein